MWVAHVIQPRLVIESGGSDDQRIAFPGACRKAHPSRIRIFLQRAAVHKDLAEQAPLMQDGYYGGSLNDSAGKSAGRGDARYTVGKAVGVRVVAAIVGSPLIVQGFPPSGHGYFALEIRCQVGIELRTR